MVDLIVDNLNRMLQLLSEVLRSELKLPVTSASQNWRVVLDARLDVLTVQQLVSTDHLDLTMRGVGGVHLGLMRSG